MSDDKKECEIIENQEDNEAELIEGPDDEEIIECDEDDFGDVLTQQAMEAESMQKKDEQSTEGKRKTFDSADYWMEHQKDKNKN